jgi:Leucine Rich repeat
MFAKNFDESVRLISLSNRGLSASSVESVAKHVVAKSKGAAKVALDVSQNQLGDDGVAQLVGALLSQQIHIVGLNIASNQLSQRAIASLIAPLGNADHGPLVLDVSFNAIRCSGAVALASLAKRRPVESLCAIDCQIRDAGARTLLHALAGGGEQLRCIDLSSNDGITEDSCGALVRAFSSDMCVRVRQCEEAKASDATTAPTKRSSMARLRDVEVRCERIDGELERRIDERCARIRDELTLLGEDVARQLALVGPRLSDATADIRASIEDQVHAVVEQRLSQHNAGGEHNDDESTMTLLHRLVHRVETLERHRDEVIERRIKQAVQEMRAQHQASLRALEVRAQQDALDFERRLSLLEGAQSKRDGSGREQQDTLDFERRHSLGGNGDESNSDWSSLAESSFFSLQ